MENVSTSSRSSSFIVVTVVASGTPAARAIAARSVVPAVAVGRGPLSPEPIDSYARCPRRTPRPAEALREGIAIGVFLIGVPTAFALRLLTLRVGIFPSVRELTRPRSPCVPVPLP